MANFIKCASLLLLAVVWVSAAPLPSPPPCQPDRNVTPVTPEEYRLMEYTFRDLVGDTQRLSITAQEYFNDEGIPNECASADIGIATPVTFDRNSDYITQLAQYYFNLTRLAFRTGGSLIEEEQLELKLQPSFYSLLSAIKEKLFNGTVTLRKELVTRGYWCVQDIYPNATAKIPVACPTRYIGLVTDIVQLNNAAAQVESLLLLASNNPKKE